MKKGYRLCLVYNLIHAESDTVPSTVDTAEAVARVSKALEAWIKDTGKFRPVKLVYPLDHQNTTAGLSFKDLKNHDLAVASLLLRAQQRCPIELYLATVTLLESGREQSPNMTYSLDTWVNTDNQVVDLGKMPASLEKYEFLGGKDLAEYGPDDESVEEAAGKDETLAKDLYLLIQFPGNEGATVERWYHRVAFVFWPKDNEFQILTSLGSKIATEKLLQVTVQLSLRSH